MQAPQLDLPSTLDKDVQLYRLNTFASSTWRTYSAQLSAYLDFCGKLNIRPAPISQQDLGRYIAFLSHRLSFKSIRQYLNIVRLINLDSGFKNPLDQNWYVSSILKGVRRIKGDATHQKLPITLEILKEIFMKLNLNTSFDRSFWTACLEAFFSFFRKSNLLVQSHILFNPSQHLCASDVKFTPEGAVLTVRWSKVIQFKERVLHIPLPRIPKSPFCPSTALLLLSLKTPMCPNPVPLVRYSSHEATNVPLTQKCFTDKLRSCLAQAGYEASSYSGHLFRHAGASYALQCGLPVELIKLQGDWKSNAYERYLEPFFNLRKKLAATMGKSVQTFFSMIYLGKRSHIRILESGYQTDS